MGLLPKETVALSGARTSYAVVLPAYMEDRNQRLALVSPLFQRNIGVQSGHKVQVIAERKTPALAESVTLQVDDDLDLQYLKARATHLGVFWHERVLVAEDWLAVPTLDRNPLMVQVVATQPEGLVQIGHGTTYVLTAINVSGKLPGVAGLRDAYRTCQNLGVARLKTGLSGAARSVLLTGPSGCGKSRLVHRLGAELGFPIVALDAHHLIDRQMARNPEDLGVSPADLARRGPNLLLLDHLDALVVHERSPKALVAASRVVLARLSTLIDEASLQPGLMVFGIGSDDVDQLFKEHQHFDVILPVDAPNRPERYEILSLFAQHVPLAAGVDLGSIAAITPGATARDLNRLVSTASRLAHGSRVAESDFVAASRHIELSASGSLRCDIPDVSWSDVAGLDDIKQLLRETLSWSLKHNGKFADAGIQPPRSILLSGGRGTGKTSLVRALAGVAPIHFVEINCSFLASFGPGVAAHTVRDGFSLARRKSPCLIFLDDIDVLFELKHPEEFAPSLSPLVAQILAALDGLAFLPGVVVVASTNRPDRLSDDILRPGRFDFAITLPMPEHLARKKILQIHARKLPLTGDIDFDRLATITKGMSPAEIAALCNRVGLMALRQSLSEESGGLLPPVANAALFEQAMRGRKG